MTPISTTVIPSQPARLKCGEREIPVPSQPMVRTSRSRRDVELITEGPDVLIVAPLPLSWLEWVGKWVAALIINFGGAGTLVASALSLGDGIVWAAFLAVLGLALAVIGVLMLAGLLLAPGPLRFHFDRRGQALTADRIQAAGRGWVTQFTRPLSDIAALQLLYGGYYSISHTSEAASTIEQFENYEMNLLLADESQPRLHLCTHSDWQWMRTEGAKLAEFLQVPVVDQLCRGT